MQNNRLQQLLEMLRHQPDDPFLLYAAGVEYEALHDNAHATLFFDELLANHPDYLPVYYKYAVMLALDGHCERATSLFEKGVTLAQQQGDAKTLRELKSALENMD